MESLNMTIGQARELLDKYIADPMIKLHLRESEVFMRALARKIGGNEEDWGVIGLLHDIDWDLTKNDPSQHCVKAKEILKDAGASDFLVETVISHGYGIKEIPAYKEKSRLGKIQYCLAAAETLTGIIIAAALVRPDKKLGSVNLQSLKKKFKDKSFAAKCDRNIILECEKAGIPLDDFLETGLVSLQGIAAEIGL